MSDPLDPADIQGNILRGYHKPVVRHLVLGVRDPAAARQWLADATGGDAAVAPQVTTAERWAEPPNWCLNVGLTHAGLAALSVPDVVLDSFPEEFRQGMAARAVKLGDTGPSHPDTWKPEWRDPAAVHLVVSVHADEEGHLDQPCNHVLGAARGTAFAPLAQLDGRSFPDGVVHFGYVDGIAQPRLAGVPPDDTSARPDRQPEVELGAVLLGHPTPVEGVRWEVPQPDVVGHNGCFSAFRVLEQQVEAFEQFLDDQADRLLAARTDVHLLPADVEHAWDPPVTRRQAVREVLAAKLLGRWRNGVPLVRSPTTPTPQPPIGPDDRNDFGFAEDPDGLACPISSHIRRCNPRDARIVQRNANHSRRLVRRGIPYGPQYAPGQPPAERGLLGVFLCASLVSQFEAVQYDWINLGLSDPRVTATNDPVVGNNDPTFSVVRIPTAAGPIEIRGFGRFVHTRGGAYLFLPSLRALRHLGGD